MIMTGEVYTLTLDTVYFLKTVKKVTVQAMHNLTVATLKKAIADRKSFIYQENRQPQGDQGSQSSSCLADGEDG